jgi:NAD(P)-dependent dehydrogenase (short-subunit alcohol dehydrogenase family)
MGFLGVAVGFAFAKTSQTTRRVARYASLSADSYSATPGTLDEEDQPVRTPLDSNSTVLVVGATRGIGLEFVRQLLAKGSTVVATHREAEPPQTLQSLADSGGQLSFLQMDVGDGDSVQAAAAAFGGKGMRLTHIIHSAGIYGPQGTLDGVGRQGRASYPAVTKEAMMSVFEINAVGPLLVAQNFSPFLKPSPSCALPVISILTSKMGSIDDNGSGGAYAYRTSKSALNAIAKSLYVDLKSSGKATVCLLHPGYVRTDMTDGNGLIDCDESVAGLLKAIEATGPETPYRWIDFKACLIPW